MRVESVVMGLIVLSAIMVGMFTFVGDTAEQYGVDIDEESFSAPYDSMQENIQKLNDSYAKLAAEGLDPGDLAAGLGMVASIVTLIVETPFNVMNSVFDFTFGIIGVPVWVSSLIIGLFMVFIVFALIAFFWKKA